MFEGAVAAVLNRFLGKYVQDLDTENLNVGIFGGDVQLHDLRLKPEALYELDLPIEVKAGTIGRVALNIPWSGLYTQSVVVNIEDVYVVVGPVTQGPHNPEREKRLLRAAKRRRLEGLETGNWLSAGLPDSGCFLENLITTVMNNLQVFVRNVHIRYEDTITRPGICLACGICVSSVSIEFTNNKWKPCASSPGATSVYQLIRIEACSLYWNSRGSAVIGDQDPDSVPLHVWRGEMELGLQTFCVQGDQFKFIIKPVSAKVKVIVNRSNEARVPKLLVDFVVEDIPTQLTRAQYLSMQGVGETLARVRLRRKYHQYHPGPGVPVHSHASSWWRYAFNAVLAQRVRPYTWSCIKKHREVYAQYRDTFRRTLLAPTDTELKVDLQQLEDQLGIVDIVIAREHAKIQLHKEDPDRVSVGERRTSWWAGLDAARAAVGSDTEIRSPSPELQLQVRSERARGLWTQLSAGERDRLYEAIGYAEGAQRPDKPKHFIEHKLNVTLVNCSLSLVAHDSEILVVTLTQFLASLESRPSAGAYKLSVRAESVVVEGASLDHDQLVPLASANVASGNNYSNFIAIDFEKNPMKIEADYGLNVTMEPMEIVYHEHAVSELLNFFSSCPRSFNEVCSSGQAWVASVSKAGAKLAKQALCRRTKYQVNMDIRAPYIVIPELGCMQKGGLVLVVDFGRLSVRSELQPSGVSLEDATQMEVEERLYDRLHLDCTEMQVLFCDSGDEWLESRKMQDSELHLIPKVRCQLVFSNSVKPEYGQLARHKLTVSLSSLKLNLSDRRIGLALDFMDNIPAPSPNTIRKDSVPAGSALDSAADAELRADRMPADVSEEELARVRRLVVKAGLRQLRGGAVKDRAAAKMAMLELDKSFMSSDHSDDDMELWARTVDLPGFDDNVSPHNAITMLFRFVVGELVINLARSSNRVDKPYLLLRIGKLCWDSALMEYGPAVQASVGSVQLVDRLHPGSSGQYLEMISTAASPTEEVVTLLYRKVRSNCPDFKSHFHSVEQSLVIDIATVNLVFHQEAFTTLHKYLQYIIHKVQSREIVVAPLLTRLFVESILPGVSSLWCGAGDPPIPPGATKFSYSTRLGEVRLKLCDTDLDFLELRLGGLESDCLFKANERMVLRLYLTSLSCEDLSDVTLYHKVLLVDDDKVVELKYVRHAPRLYKHTDMDPNKDDVKSDGSVKLRLGRLRVVLLYKLAVDLQNFLEPLLRPGLLAQWMGRAGRLLERGAGRLRSWPTRLHVSLDLHAPALLLPQKSASPNLVVVTLGDLTVENFFKEVTQSTTHETDSAGRAPPVIDNVLVRLDNVQVCRAVMTLAGALHIQEPILEPLSLRLDVKRWVASRPATQTAPRARDVLLYDVSGGMDMVRINLGQRDLATLLAVWTDNLAEGRFIADVTAESHPASPLEPGSPSHAAEDQTVRKLQAFFCQNEQVRREACVRLTLDGLQLFLFNDIDEILSSPVRDLNHGLCKLELGEASLSLDTFTDHSLELRTSLLCCVLEDIRPEHPAGMKKIFQSHGGMTHTDSSAISVSRPPIVDLTFRQSQAGDRCVDILVEQTRLNLSVSFLAALARFTLDALPGERYVDGGFINQGYVGDLNVHKSTADCLKTQRPPSSADSTSGYFSSRASCAEEQAGLSVSLQLRKPEVLLVAEPLVDPTARGPTPAVPLSPSSNSLLLRTELLLDYSRHPGRESLVCSLAGLQVLAQPPPAGTSKRHPQQVLYPCDIEFAKSFKSAEEGIKMTGTVSPVDIRLCASTVHTILDVVEDVTAALQTEEPDPALYLGPIASDAEDLWSPKKTQPYLFPDPCEALLYTGNGYSSRRWLAESLVVSMPKVRVVLELEAAPAGGARVPLLVVRVAAETTAHDWSRQMHLKSELQLQASYYNGEVGVWEPLIEPVVEEENVYRPWELQIKVFQAKSFPISSHHENADGSNGEGSRRSSNNKRSTAEKRPTDESQTSGEDTEPEHSMTFIRRPRSDCGQDGRRQNESVSMVGYPDDSDSENDEGVMEKLACAIGHLFTGDSSEGEASESDESSGEAEPSGATEEASEMETGSAGGSTVIGNQERAIFLKKHSDSVDSGLEAEPTERYSIYTVVHARDHLELSMTPAALHVLTGLANAFCRVEPVVLPPPGADAPLALRTTLGPTSSVTLTTKAEVGPDGNDKELLTSSYDKSDSRPSSPGSEGAPAHHDISPTESEMDIDCFEGGYSAYSSHSQADKEALSPLTQFPPESVSKLYKLVTDHRLTLHMDGFDPMQVLCPQRSSHKLHTLSPARHNTRYHVVLSVNSSFRHSSIVLRSPLQIRNETSYAMGLYYKKTVLEALGVPQIGESTNPFEGTIRMAIVEPDETYDVPLYIAYHCKIFLLPAYVDSYHVSETGLWWQDLAADMNTPRDVFCPAKEEKDPTVFSLRALSAEGAPIKRMSRSIPNYLVRLLPPLAMHNRLPYAVEVKIPSIKYEVRIEAGEKASVYFLNLMKMHKIVVEVPAYLGLAWTGSFNLTSDLEEKTIAMVTEQDTEGGNKQLGLSLRVDRGTTCDVFLHAPYWVINKTGLPLQIRGSLSDVVYEAAGEEPLLFCYRKHRRRCVRLRAYHSSWSSAFSLDTVGTAGLVVCRDRERKRHYRILLSVTLSQLCPQLTKIVTLLPNFIVSNQCSRHLRFMEENERADLWTDLAPQQCVAFWPVTDSMRMYVKYRDSKLVSQHFPITQVHRTVLRMDRGGGLVVEVSGGGDQPFSIAFRGYTIGDAPVRVDNLCEDLFLKIHQQDLGQVALLSPYQSMLYTWDDPSRERSLLWNVYNKKCKGFVSDFWKDGYGQERVCFHSVRQPSCSGTASPAPTVTSKLSAGLKLLTPKTATQDGSSSSDDTESDELLRPQHMKRTRRDKVVVYWVSFLEGHQRVLLFTQDERVACQARRRIQSERAHYEFFLSLSGVGVSLNACSGDSARELAYLSLTESAAVWEVSVAHRWKPLTLELASWIEDKWRQDHKKAQMKDYVHVDFDKMHMTKPFYGELRRRHSPAVWLQLRRSENHTYLRARVHRIQVDNQLPDAHFSTVLCPAPIPRHVACRSGVKPCVDVLLLKRHRPSYNQDVYKYIKCLVQEFCVQLDRGFLQALCEVWGLGPGLASAGLPVLPGAGVRATDKDRPAVRLRADLAVVHQPLASVSAKGGIEGAQKAVIEYLHLSPIRLRLSVCPRGGGRSSRNLGCCDMLDYVLNALLPSLTEVKNVRLRMAYFERKGVLASPGELLSDVVRHYSAQLIQQVHVFVLGLDVLGNPYGLVADFNSGFGDFFYEPFLGSVESPDEYAEGLSAAAQALVGHLTGAGGSALALVAPSLDAILPNLIFDDEYKKKRRFCLQQTTDLPELARAASKTFTMGVLLGLSGVVLKPTLGAPQEGVEGFFRGSGKGLLGLMTKPSGGVVDCIAMAHDGIKRAAELGEDLMLRSRLPRHLNPYMGVRPFSLYQATGLQLLQSLSKGHYADSDTYWAHAALDREGKSTLLISLQHVFLVERCRQWGASDVEWVVRVDDIMAVPTVESQSLVFKVRQDEVYCAFSGDERSVKSEDSTVLIWLKDKVEAVLVLNMEDKPVPANCNK